MTDALHAAMLLAAEGLPCFPCAATKQPKCPGGFTAATTNPEALRDQWRAHPGPLVGVPTGTNSGIDVLDIDGPRHAEAAAWYTDHRDHLPVTRVHRTRSGGLHLLMRHSAGMRSTASRIATGVDTRGDGGYIIWWPAAGLPVLSDASPAPWPEWLLDALRPPPIPPAQHRLNAVITDARLAGLVRLVAAAPVGQRNRVLYWAACRIAKAECDGGFTAEVLTAAAARAGLAATEAMRTIRSALRRAEGGTP